jgi:hypothetical protein
MELLNEIKSEVCSALNKYDSIVKEKNSRKKSDGIYIVDEVIRSVSPLVSPEEHHI